MDTMRRTRTRLGPRTLRRNRTGRFGCNPVVRIFPGARRPVPYRGDILRRTPRPDGITPSTRHGGYCNFSSRARSPRGPPDLRSPRLVDNSTPKPVTYQSGVPSWPTFRQAFALIIAGRTARTAFPVAIIVGIILSTINEGVQIATGHASSSTWTRVGLNFVVPYFVASVGYLTPLRRRG